MSAADLLKVLQDRLYNVDLEKSILAHVINLKDDQIELLTSLDAKYFSDTHTHTLYKIVYEMFTSKLDISLDSVESWIPIKAKGAETKKLKELIQQFPAIKLKDTVFNSAYLLKETYRNRVIYNEIIQKVNVMFSDNEPIDVIIEHIAQSLLSVETGKKEIKVVNLVENVVDSIMNSVQDEVGLDTGLNDMDLTFSGIKPDRYIGVGAESGAGKTAFIIDLIERLCVRYPDKVAMLFFSLEMSERRIIKRLISRKTGLSVQKLEQKMKQLTKEEKALVKAAGDAIAKYPLQIIYDTVTANQMLLRVRKFAMENPDKHLFVMVDHIGLVSGLTNDERINTIKASTACKSMCRDYGATTIVLTQFTKEIDSMDNRKNFHRPHMGYIMESGRIRQDADIIGLLWRPETRFATIPFAGIPDWKTEGKLIWLNEKNRDGFAPSDMIFGQNVATNHIFNTTDIFT